MFAEDLYFVVPEDQALFVEKEGFGYGPFYRDILMTDKFKGRKVVTIKVDTNPVQSQLKMLHIEVE